MKYKIFDFKGDKMNSESFKINVSFFQYKKSRTT